jgi:hypothetical protein
MASIFKDMMLGNWVYFVLNACLVVTNTLALAMAIHRRGVNSRSAATAAGDSQAGDIEAMSRSSIGRSLSLRERAPQNQVGSPLEHPA